MGNRSTKIMIVWITSETRDYDAKWYYRCRTWCENQANEYNVALETVVGVLAALSPSCAYETNQRDTVAMLSGRTKYKYTTYKRNVAKARAIFDGAPVEATLAPKPRRSGMKTLAFYRAIMRPWEPTNVVIDRHALAVAHGETFEKGVTYRRYRDFVASYQSAARSLGVSPIELQAATWCAWRTRKVA